MRAYASGPFIFGITTSSSQQVNSVAVCTKQADSLFAVAGQHYVVAQVRKRFPRQLAQPFVVLGDQNRFVAAVDGLRIVHVCRSFFAAGATGR